MTMKPSEYLTDAYVEMVGQLFGDILDGPSFCALEFMVSHGHLMSDTQRKALSAFIEFWGALEDLEYRTESTNENQFRR